MFFHQDGSRSHQLVSSIPSPPPHKEVVGWQSLIILYFNRWLFEKYDGVRGFWNPTKRAFYSRLGNQLRIPQEIVDAMPSDIFLDGELWYTPPTKAHTY